jgi:hypothetical protein
MPDYALFLKCNFNSIDGNFVDNPVPIRKPDARFWSEVQPGAGGVLTAVNQRFNADTKMLEATAAGANPDKIYFAVQVVAPNNTVVRNISFMCGIQMNIRRNAATAASPFRQNGQIQVNLSTAPNQQIQVPPLVGGGAPDVYDAIGPYTLVRDPGAAPAGECCYYKLTVTSSIKNNTTGVIKEFSHDPDMDVEL